MWCFDRGSGEDGHRERFGKRRVVNAICVIICCRQSDENISLWHGKEVLFYSIVVICRHFDFNLHEEAYVSGFYYSSRFVPGSFLGAAPAGDGSRQRTPKPNSLAAAGCAQG